MNSSKLEHFKNKQENARSAVASQEVREHLAGFILSKRLGSSSQLIGGAQDGSNQNIAGPSKQRSLDQQQYLHQHQNVASVRRQDSSQSTCGTIATTDATSYNIDGGTCQFGTTQPSDEDHPLRKTASMPTMHIPCKAQSLSRRKQMERRTTLSPLMKRKSRRRGLLAQQQQNQIDYSAPSHSNQRSSSSPPTHRHAQQQQPQDNPPSSDVEILQSNLQTFYFSPKSHQNVDAQKLQTVNASFWDQNNQSGVDNRASPTTLHKAKSNQHLTNELDNFQQESSSLDVEMDTSQSSYVDRLHNKLETMDTKQHQQQYGSSLAASNFSLAEETLKLESTFAAATNMAQADQQKQFKDAQTFLRQQQHQKVNEVIRKTVLERSSSRGRVIMASGSLDIDGGDNASKQLTGQQMGAGCELRQWSLDAADLCTGTSTGAGAGPPGKSTWTRSTKPTMAFRDPYRAATCLRNLCQSPSGAVATNGQQQTVIVGRITAPAGYAQQKQQSSSSSSTSSVLSQQDSFDDSSSQAIDLSSSSDVSRHHHSRQTAVTQAQAQAQKQGQPQHPPNPFVLQESFNQLQLCQRQQLGREDIQQLLRSMDEASLGLQHARHPPRLSSANKASCSLDNAGHQHQQHQQHANLFATLPSQFNLSTSAQNLMSADPHLSNYSANLNSHLNHLSGYINQKNACHQGGVPFDYNSLLMHQQHQQQQNSAANFAFGGQQHPLHAPQQFVATGSMHADLGPLSESYRSALISQLAHQQQQQQQQQQQHQNFADEMKKNLLLHRSLIGRTLSSPLLPSSSSSSASSSAAAAAAADQFRMQHLSTAEMLMIKRMTNGDNIHQQRRQMLVDEKDENVVEFGSQRKSNADSSLDLSFNHYQGVSRPSAVVAGNAEANIEQSQEPQQQILNFHFQPIDLEQYNARYILNPIFDQSSKTGITYELDMCNHKCTCRNDSKHPENSRRVLTIWRRLYDKGLMARCAKVESRAATLEELQLCHSEIYSIYFGTTPAERGDIINCDLSKLPIDGLLELECSGIGIDADTAWNESLSPMSSRMAAGCCIEAALSVAQGKLKNAFAIVRPPGQHAEYQLPMGFCFFNNISIAAKVLAIRLHLTRILIVDFDIHHGNGIQKVFYSDETVLYISIHRHDKGQFFPGTGYIREVGAGLGEGYNFNIAWHEELMADCEYLAAFRTIVMPISREFNPEIVLVACGFDASNKHAANFGGYKLTPACYGWMTRQLMSLASGKLVLCLEGGYQLESVADCSEQCVKSLVGDEDVEQVDECERSRRPNAKAVEVLREVSSLAAKYWPSVEKYHGCIDMSAITAERIMNIE